MEPAVGVFGLVGVQFAIRRLSESNQTCCLDECLPRTSPLLSGPEFGAEGYSGTEFRGNVANANPPILTGFPSCVSFFFFLLLEILLSIELPATH